MTISGLQEKQGAERSWLQGASGAHLYITLSCETDVKMTPALYLCEKNGAGVENDPSFKYLGLLTLGTQNMFRPLLLATS